MAAVAKQRWKWINCCCHVGANTRGPNVSSRAYPLLNGCRPYQSITLNLQQLWLHNTQHVTRPMLNHNFLSSEGILVLEPEASLEAADFESLASEIDPYIAKHRRLPGVMIHAKAFPGWTNLEAISAHMRFVESHHQKIQKLAVVSDSRLLTELPRIIGHLVHPEVKLFPESGYEEALRWLRQATTTQE